MSIRCVFKNDRGEQCEKMVDTGVLCVEHAEAEKLADPGAAKAGGGGGGGGWSIFGRTRVVYQKED